MKEKILVSACLLGTNCKYNGKNNYSDEIMEFLKDYEIIPVCPEIMGGLPTPRPASEIVGNKVMSINNNDVTQNYQKGAFLPTGDDIFLNKKNIYFVGDASGLISPITGEGIYYALYSAQQLFECFQNNKNYTKLMKPTCKKIKKELFLIKIIYNEKIRKFVFSKMTKNRKLSKVIKNKVKKLLLN
jgi:hypothetical protein